MPAPALIELRLERLELGGPLGLRPLERGEALLRLRVLLGDRRPRRFDIRPQRRLLADRRVELLRPEAATSRLRSAALSRSRSVAVAVSSSSAVRAASASPSIASSVAASSESCPRTLSCGRSGIVSVPGASLSRFACGFASRIAFAASATAFFATRR